MLMNYFTYVPHFLQFKLSTNSVFGTNSNPEFLQKEVNLKPFEIPIKLKRRSENEYHQHLAGDERQMRSCLEFLKGGKSGDLNLQWQNSK